MRGGRQQDIVEKSRVVLKPLFQDLAEGTHGDACSSLFRRWKKMATTANPRIWGGSTFGTLTNRGT